MLNTLSRATPTIVQGITGRMGRTHAALMRAYGTNIVGGTSTRTDVPEAAGVPVFANCADAVQATGAIASVAMAPPEVVVVDLGSTNGTRVNGATVRERVLSDGDNIVVGTTTMRFEAS